MVRADTIIVSRRTAITGIGVGCVGFAYSNVNRAAALRGRIAKGSNLATPQAAKNINHTDVVQAVMDNVLAIVTNLDLPTVLAQESPRITADQVFGAALQVDTIDPSIRAQIQSVREGFSAYREELLALPNDTKENLRSLICLLNGCSDFPSMVYQLGRISQGAIFGDEQLAGGAKIAIDFLRAGEETIYNPDNSFYELVTGGPIVMAQEVVMEVAGEDATGAVCGFAEGGAHGAALGAAAESIMAAVDAVIEGLGGDDDVNLLEGLDELFGKPPA